MATSRATKIESSDATNILVVDDDHETRELLREILNEEGYRVTTSGSGEEALEIGQREFFDVIISDMKLGPDLDGLDVLRAYKSIQPESEVILLTAFGSMETACEAVKAGAFDYISKPFKIDEVVLQVGRALQNRSLIRENRNLKRQLGSQAGLSRLIGRSPGMLDVYKKIGMIADSRSTVLIYGESGTGKELVARAIHHNGCRAQQMFFAVNCGGLAETLLETELFGHMRGSFTGAFENKRGIFEEASGGTVFLDEVSEMSPALQVALLRTIEDQKIRRVGSNQWVKIDVRLIAASNRNLADLVKEGRFREDLYYRLRVIELDLPPLRERSEDIPLLVHHFLKQLGRERGQTFSISNEALSALVTYWWPGNVRELGNALEAAVALNRTGVVTPEHLPPKVRVGEGDGTRLEYAFRDWPSLEALEERFRARVIKLTGDNKSQVAAIMGVDRKTVYRLAEKYKLST